MNNWTKTDHLDMTTRNILYCRQTTINNLLYTHTHTQHRHFFGCHPEHYFVLVLLSTVQQINTGQTVWETWKRKRTEFVWLVSKAMWWKKWTLRGKKTIVFVKIGSSGSDFFIAQKNENAKKPNVVNLKPRSLLFIDTQHFVHPKVSMSKSDHWINLKVEIN